MKLHELHVNQFGPCVIGNRNSSARTIPAVAGDFINTTHAPRGNDYCFGLKNFEESFLAIITKCAYYFIALL